MEVFNKTVKKFLQSFVDEIMLNWKTFLLSLAISYNTIYHSTITTLFELLFREKADIPNEDIQQLHYGETFAAESFNLLQNLRAQVHQHASKNIEKSKAHFEKDTSDHQFQIGDKVLISNDFYTGKNLKWAPSYKGPGEIIDINDTNAKVKIGNKIKVLNLNKLKIFHQEIPSETDTTMQDLNFNDAPTHGPISRKLAILINYKNAAQLALLMLSEEGDTNIDSLCAGPCIARDSENYYFKLNPPQRK